MPSIQRRDTTNRTHNASAHSLVCLALPEAPVLARLPGCVAAHPLVFQAFGFQYQLAENVAAHSLVCLALPEAPVLDGPAIHIEAISLECIVLPGVLLLAKRHFFQQHASPKSCPC